MMPEHPLAFDVVTIFPEMFAAVGQYGVTRRGLEEGRWTLNCWNPRDFTADNYRRVDDRPFGGGFHGDDFGQYYSPALLRTTALPPRHLQSTRGLRTPYETATHSSSPKNYHDPG